MTQYSIVQQAPSHLAVGWFFYCCQWSSHTLERFMSSDDVELEYVELSTVQ